MKKLFLVFPLAVMMANCSSTHNTSGSTTGPGTNTTTSASGSGIDANASTSGSVASSGTTTDNSTTTGSGTTTSSGTAGSASGSTGISGNASASMGSTASGNMHSRVNGSANTATWNSGATASAQTAGTTNWDVYDPNNYMQNPDKYMRPDQLTKTGGWTYNRDWRRNTNFTQEAVGQWELVLTPEVAAHWMPDTRRPETYASFWTPEAIMARYQANMAAAARVQDSIAALNAATASTNTSLRSGRRKNSMNRNSANMNSGTWSSGSGTTGAVGTGGSAEVSGSGTTATMGTGGASNVNATTDNATGMTSNNVTIPYALTAVNGNNYLLPSLNMYIDNGSFTAYTGCNNALGNIVVNGSSLHFQEASPTSSIDCIGGFEQTAFLDLLRRADSYDVSNNQFRLKQGDQVLMIFAKKAQ